MFESKKETRFQKRKQTEINVAEWGRSIKEGNRTILAKAITLIESNHPYHFQQGQQLLQEILPFTGNSIRIGITGVPGAGKSSFIEKFGVQLCKMGKKVAVLAIDPSSSVSKGSILGDKTRMEYLSRESNAFIRPSPSEGNLGGVHRKTRESILLCEAAGFDVILVETVGVGQSEVVVRTLVDMLIMLTITGAGDELQSMKKGIMELCDTIVITKADGENKPLANQTKREFNRILRLLKPATEGWKVRALTSSALTGEGILDVWNEILAFKDHSIRNKIFYNRRRQQTKDWLHESILQQLKTSFLQNESVNQYWPVVEKAVADGELPVSSAVEQLMSAYLEGKIKR